MLSNSPEGLRGLEALYKYYAKHNGVSAAILANAYDYTLCDDDNPLMHGHLCRNEKRVFVSPQGPVVARDFTIFHEMAHDAMYDVAPVFSAETLPLSIADDIEYWCDHFALAMFFAERGAVLITTTNYAAFFTQGNAAAYDGSDSRTPWRQSRVLSKRIPLLARAFLGAKTAAYRDSMQLRDALRESSRLIKERES